MMIFCPSISTTSPKLTLAFGLVSAIPFTDTIPQIIKSLASLLVKKKSLFFSNFPKFNLAFEFKIKGFHSLCFDVFVTPNTFIK